MFSHGTIAMFDSALRKAWYSYATFPLSDALFVSATLGSKCKTLVHTGNPRSINFRRPNKYKLGVCK